MFKIPYMGIIGHRGICDKAQENSIEAFRAAIGSQVDCIETDLQLSADNIWYCWHDATLERYDHTTRTINSLTAAEIDAIDSDTMPAIVRVSELLELYAGTGITINTEFKVLDCALEHYTGEALKLLQLWPENLPPPLVSSFSQAFTTAVRQALPLTHIALLADGFSETLEQLGKEQEVTSLNISLNKFSSVPEAMFSSKERPLLMCYTVNNIQTAHKLLNAGVDCIFTDSPLEMVAKLAVYAGNR